MTWLAPQGYSSTMSDAATHALSDPRHAQPCTHRFLRMSRQGRELRSLCCPARVTSFTMAETLLSQQPMFLSVRESSGTDDSQPARLWCALIYGPENSHGILCLRPSALTFGQGQTSCPSFSRCPSFFRGPSSTPRPPLLAHFQKHREWKKGSIAALAHFHIALRERCRQTVMTEP